MTAVDTLAPYEIRRAPLVGVQFVLSDVVGTNFYIVKIAPCDMRSSEISIGPRAAD